jgi:hypothetical protein
MQGMDLKVALSEAATGPGPALGRLTHALVDPTWAPADLIPPLSQFLETYPFDTNVFAMMRFPVSSGSSDSPDVLSACVTALRESCSAHGLTLHLASDRALVDDLWGNVLAHMWGCRYGVAVFEDHVDQGINYNLTIEVGGMMMAGRRTALLKDHTVPAMPTDLVGQIYRPVDLNDPATVSKALHTWLSDDLDLERCAECRSWK